MKFIHIVFSGMALAWAGTFTYGQNLSDSIRVTYKNKTVSVKPQGDESVSTIKFRDTAAGKKITVKVAVADDDAIANPGKDSSSGNKKNFNIKLGNTRKEERAHFIETSFVPTLDLGLVSSVDHGNHASVTPRLGNSVHVGLGLVRQNMNLYKNGRILLSYGIGLNAYYFKYEDKQQMQYLNQHGHLTTYRDSINTYYRNRQNLRYVNIPLMLEYHAKNDKFHLGAGLEFGFNAQSSQTLKGEKDGLRFGLKTDNRVGFSPEQLNAMLRIGIGKITVFGKYSLTELYRGSVFEAGKNPDQHLFSFGVCLLGV